jgi:hypothetical protein
MILADDTLPMAQHAAAQGWITSQALPEVAAEKKADEAPPGPVEKMLGEEAKPAAPTVVLKTDSPQETKAAVESGAIEQALETSKDEGQKPSTVVVEGDKNKPLGGEGNTPRAKEEGSTNSEDEAA